MHRYQIKELWRMAKSLLLPNHCPFCDGIIGAGEYWCEGCYNHLPFLDKMPRPVGSVDQMYSVCSYTGAAVKAVHRMKDGLYSYAPEAFGLLMTELSGDITEHIDVVTAVPTSFRRRLEIGYDHTARLARDIAVRRRFKYRRLLKEKKSKQEQKRLSRKERFENARSSCTAINADFIKGKNVLLIDDVSTTGATLSAAAAALKKAGAAKVFGLTFAKVRYARPKKSYRLTNGIPEELKL